MQCPYCEYSLTGKYECERCGSDVRPFKKLHILSNRCYNRGLSKAKVRDLSGAITELKNSLKMNKRNTDARNLLGLVYSEIGDPVNAIGEWIISRHFQGEDNEANHYLSYFQVSRNRLDLARQTIKKYNTSLKLAKNGSDDLAVIQLKKLISLNPHHVKGLQLLSLVYIRNRKFSAAKKCLEEALKIDCCNRLTLAYLQEVKESGQSEEKVQPKNERVLFADSDSFAPASAYKEEKRSVLPWVNLVLGIVLGATFFATVLLPDIKAKSIEGKKAEIVSLNETLAETNATVHQIKNENEDLKKKVEEVTKKNEDLLNSAGVKKASEGKSLTDNLVYAANFYIMKEEVKAADALVKVNKEKLKDKDALNLYHFLAGELFEKQSSDAFVEGRDLYNQGKYEEALKKLQASLKMNPDNVDSMYFIGRTYDRQGVKDKAAEWYKKIIDEYGNTARATEARQKLNSLGGN